MSIEVDQEEFGPDIAIVGMAGRFPGADTLEEFWALLREGREGITDFSDDELRANGVPAAALADPAYVKRVGVLRDIESFDAAFFGYSPREAEAMEPAHRIFLECAWEALEDAGCDPSRFPGAVGVYAGTGEPSYTQNNVLTRPEVVAALGDFQVNMGSNKDFFATRTAYKLDLRGPAVGVQTGCSTSLVAVHLASQALLNHECDVALAGGASVNVPHRTGYLWQPAGILSQDGHCRAFDARATGTQGGNGAGVVVLKRLQDAVRDGDTVHAVIRGSAVNNDGALKVAFTAPSVAGQAAVIGEALAAADVDPETIRYVEGHGSGTELGDPIEIAALSEAFGSRTAKRGFCAVGSVKASIGHLDAAAGVAGLIKTVLAMENRIVPPTPNFETPNPKIDFARSAFYVSPKPEPWEANGTPRRAGVSSFGIGGTNAHVILEEAPTPRPSAPRRPWHLLALSAKTPTALDAATARLAEHLRAHPRLPLADVAHTLQTGRRELAHRRMLVVRDGEDAAALLEARHPDRVVSGAVDDAARSVAFMFPGVGDQYPQMARGLYETEPVFRAEVDRCAGVLRSRFGIDLLAALFPGDAPEEPAPGAGIDLRRMLAQGAPDPAAEALDRTDTAQPAVFVIEYALAKLWMSWGIVPAAVIGHSLGEYAAATIAGVFTLEDALELVTARGRMIQPLPAGAMLAVPLSASDVEPFLVDDAAVATINAPAMCVVAGPVDAVETVRVKLEKAGHVARRLAATHAFHSPMMDPVVAPVQAMVAKMRLAAPSIPFVSNVTGTWITPAQATDAAYWARHLRQPVQFERGVGELLREPGRVLLEVGPGQTLSTFVRQRGETGAAAVIPTVRYPYDRTSDTAFALSALGRLWLAGITPDWAAFHEGERLRRVPLPTYPWERQRYWVDPPKEGEQAAAPRAAGRRDDPAEWLYLPAWKRVPAVRPAADDGARWIVFHDGTALGDGVVTELRAHGRDAVVVRPGERFAKTGEGEYTLRPDTRHDYDNLVAALTSVAETAGSGDGQARVAGPLSAIHLWALAEVGAHGRAFVSVALAAAALGRDRDAKSRLVAVTAGAQEVTGGEAIDPFAATVVGACAVVGEEHPGVACRSVDVQGDDPAAAPRLAVEALSDARDAAVAIRGGRRWVRGFEPVRPADASASPLREGGVYFLSGGLDGRNGEIARHLFERWRARLVVADRLLPDRRAWDAAVAARPAGDPIRTQIEVVRELEARGAEVLALPQQMYSATQAEEAFQAAEQRFGAVHGVIAAPRVEELGGFEALGDVLPSEWSRHLGLIANELEARAAAAERRALDFVLLESSLSPELGGVGRARVAAAHAFVDAFAQRQARSGAAWTALAWDRWFDAGETPQGYGMAPAGAMAALEHALTLADEPRLLLSTGDVAARIAESAAPAAAVAGGYARPELETAYFPPTTESEELVATMWQELLGIDRIGIHDDFFGLGGHSLLATQIISRTRDQFGLELPLKAVFEAPTIARFAALVEEAIMAEIEAMSEDEILSLV
ncbi:MAG TPA: beta-ketoacyl synthase N-terminal-like domain-containing protein [Longimicrobium sp.]|nr:beta-ketoacyl synthase N-terminal-like domain-containing protein [Longimicrobium sp.]